MISEKQTDLTDEEVRAGRRRVALTTGVILLAGALLWAYMGYFILTYRGDVCAYEPCPTRWFHLAQFFAAIAGLLATAVALYFAHKERYVAFGWSLGVGILLLIAWAVLLETYF